VSSAPLGPAVEVVHGDRSRQQVALTFHGAGDPALAVALLDAAEKGGARVTVLAVGTWLEANPAMVKRILDGGHELGNHTYTHPALATLGSAATFEEISRCADLLRHLAGSPGTWFRPSGTPHATARILAEAGRAGYARTLSYDVDTLDYTDPGVAAVVAHAKAGIRPGSVVSLHLGHAGTVAALPKILDDLHAQGLTAVTASALLTA
jgi:peptidoglycan/xylan/chitin deacetylase (PgdA/CDA1 family)